MKAWLSTYQNNFNDQINSGRLPHAILLSGVHGSGKEELALWLGSNLLCQLASSSEQKPCGQCKSCHLAKNKTHPDLMEVITDGASVSVEQIRALGRFFETKTHIANHKIAIVYQAQTMTVAAANALLKTLEEPNDNSFIILVSKDEQLMLPTILSRCQVVKLRANLEQTGSMLASHSGQFTNLTHLPEMTNQEVNDDYQKLEHHFVAFLADTKQANALLNSLTGNEHAWRMLEKLIVNLARNKQSWYSNANFSSPIKTELCTKLYHAFLDINETRVRLPQANQQLLLEKLIFNFANLIEQRA